MPLSSLFAASKLKSDVAPESAHLRHMALDAQAALLPYALLFFLGGLSLFAWASSFAANGQLMLVSLAIFAVNWGVFYVLARIVRAKPQLAETATVRTRIHILGALLWAAAIAQVCGFALAAGPAREALLLLAAGGAVACFFFLAPLLPALLLVGPVVSAAPVICLMLSPDTRELGVYTSGALSLAMALSILVNRILQRQFALSVERDRLSQEFKQAAQDAQRLAKSKSALLSTLSHEVRNGLAGVTHVLAAAAGQSARSAPSREQLNAALQASRDLAEVLDATIDSENAVAGNLKIQTEPFDGARLVKDLVYLNQPQAAAKGLELSVYVEPELSAGSVNADPARTRQVLSNLIGNALKFTVRGRVEVRVTRHGEDRVRFEVADTGPGLTKAEMEEAFKPFVRIDRTSAGADGAGLGLSLAKALADLMGGAIGASSASGAGSCFWLDLPYDANARTTVEPVDPTGRDAASRTVIVALDNRLGAATLRTVLEELGHKVVQAQNAARVADLLRMCEADLVIASGPEAIRTLSMEGPAILAYVAGDASEAAECLEAGAAGVIRPPINAPAVARALAMLDGEARTQAANAA